MSPSGKGAHETASVKAILQEKGLRLVLSMFLNTGFGENVFPYVHVEKRKTIRGGEKRVE